MANRDKVEELDMVISRMYEGKEKIVPLLVLDDYSDDALVSSRENEKWYKHLEDELIRLNLCRITPDWTPNSVPFGYKTLELLPLGRQLYLEKKSVKMLYDNQQKAEAREESKYKREMAKDVFLFIGYFYIVVDVVSTTIWDKGILKAIKDWLLQP